MIARFELVLGYISDLCFNDVGKMNIQDNASRSVLLLQERKETIGERDQAGKVDRKLLVELVQVEASRVGEVDDRLSSCVEEGRCSRYRGAYQSRW